MKKLLKMILCSVMLCTMTACSNGNEAAVKNTVNSYFVSLEEGKLEDAYKYVGEDAATDFSELKETEDSLNEMLDEYNVSDATKTLFSDAFSSIIKLCVQSHKITKTEKVSDTEYKVTADASILDSDTIATAIENIDYETFLNDISSKVTEKYTSEGESAAAEYLMSSMATWFSENYTSALKDLKATARPVVITVDKQNDSWLITGMEDQE
jgi:hypothetical protein